MSAPLILAHCPRHYLRQVIVSPDELVSSSKAQDGDGTIYRPPELLDMAAYLRMLPAPHNRPSMLVHMWGPGNPALSVSGVACPKILLLGDLHHQRQPLQSALRYAISQPWDLIIIPYTRQHLRWFHEVGLSQTVWIPCFLADLIYPWADHPRPGLALKDKRKYGVSFVGQAGDLHPYRRWVLQQLIERGLEVTIMTGGTRAEAAAVHADSVVSLNISLNGDFNLRNFEVMAAGGCLLTERLCAESGQDTLLHDRQNCRIWSTVDELAALCRFYLKQPRKALAIAQAGFDYVWSTHAPDNHAKALESLLGTVTPSAAIQPPQSFWERLVLYEHCQELAKQMRLGQALHDVADLRR